MCEIMEELKREAAEEAAKSRDMEVAAKMLKKGRITEEEAMEDFDLTQDEVRQIIERNGICLR